MKTLYTTDGHEIFVDDEDFVVLKRFRWSIHNNRPTCKLGGNRFGPHHLLFGSVGSGNIIDHIDRNPFNNRKENLRIASPQENAWNASKHKNTLSKYKGVFFVKTKKKYRARITNHEKTIILGYFEDEVEAALAYDKAALFFRGEYAVLNFPKKRT